MAVVANDETFLLSDQQCLSILDWVGGQAKNGLVLRSFLASIALAALRPAEALMLRVREVELGNDGSGALLVPAQMRDCRMEGATDAAIVRRVPVGADLAAILQEEIAGRGLCPNGRVFVLDDGRPLTPPAYRKVWRQARAAVLEANEVDSPLGRTVSALRDARIAAWLRNGDQSAAHIVAVAECVGISASRLSERFANCLRKPTRGNIPWRLLEEAHSPSRIAE